MELDIDDDKIVRIRPDGSASPAGAYLCDEGRSAAVFHNGADDRLLTSLAYATDYDATPSGMRLDGSRKPTSEELIAHFCEQGATDFATLAANPGGLRPQIAPSQVLAGPPYCPDRLQICPADVAADLARLALPRRGEPRSFRLTSRRMAEALNGEFRDAARTRRRFAFNPAFGNADDMASGRLA